MRTKTYFFDFFRIRLKIEIQCFWRFLWNLQVPKQRWWNVSTNLKYICHYYVVFNGIIWHHFPGIDIIKSSTSLSVCGVLTVQFATSYTYCLYVKTFGLCSFLGYFEQRCWAFLEKYLNWDQKSIEIQMMDGIKKTNRCANVEISTLILTVPTSSKTLETNRWLENALIVSLTVIKRI